MAASATSSGSAPSRGDGDQAAWLELPGDGAAARQLAAGLGEDRADLGGRAVAVVGRGLHEDRHAAGPVALVDDLLVLDLVAAAGRLLDRALDVVGRHVDRARLVDGQPEPVVGVGVTTAGTCGDRDLARDLREHGAALGVVDALLALDRGPLGMSGHRPRVYRLSSSRRGSPSRRPRATVPSSRTPRVASLRILRPPSRRGRAPGPTGDQPRGTARDDVEEPRPRPHPQRRARRPCRRAARRRWRSRCCFEPARSRAWAGWTTARPTWTTSPRSRSSTSR